MVNLDFALTVNMCGFDSKSPKLRVTALGGRKATYAVGHYPETGEKFDRHSTQLELYQALDAAYGANLWANLTKESLYGAVVSAQAQLYLHTGEAGYQRHMQELNSRITAIFMEIITELGFSCLSSRPNALKSSEKLQYPHWKIRALVQASSDSSPVTLSAHFMPSPSVPNGWDICVRLPVGTLAEYEVNNRRIIASLKQVALATGITLEQVYHGVMLR